MTKIEKLTANLKERIHAGEWGEAQALPNRMMLATEYGVAPGTISQVFKRLEEDGLVRILPRKGVLLTDAGRGGDVAEPSGAIGLRGSYVRMGVSKKVGYTAMIVNQVLDAAHDQGVPVLILQARQDEAPLTKKRCQALGLRGIIYLGGDVTEEAKALACEGFPVISANRPVERSPLNYIDCNHIGLIHDLVKRYVEIGHHRIGMLIPPTAIPNLLYNLKPHFIEALLACGIHYNVNPYWIQLRKGKDEADTFALWRQQAEELFSLPESPTALFCWGGDVVDTLLPILKARGISVPEDISLIYAPYRDYPNEHISGYSVMKQDIGGMLLEGLLQTVENPFHFVQEEVPFEFVDKGSIAPPHKTS